MTQIDHGEFQQEPVLKQLEVLQEEEKEFQHIKVGEHREYLGQMSTAGNPAGNLVAQPQRANYPFICRGKEWLLASHSIRNGCISGHCVKTAR